MLCRYLSMKEELIQYAEYLNILQRVLTYEQFYILAYKVIPKQKFGYIKYIGKSEKKTEKIEEEYINNTETNTLLFDL